MDQKIIPMYGAGGTAAIMNVASRTNETNTVFSLQSYNAERALLVLIGLAILCGIALFIYLIKTK